VSPVTERRLQANGLAFNLAEAGDGPPVLLLHGFPDSWRLWRLQLAALAEAGHRAIAPDLRGFGETDRPTGVEHYKLRTLVNDAVGLLDVLEVERAAVVGHDWGAALAWAVARFVPDRVSRLVVVSVGHPLANAAAGLAQRQLSWYMLWFLFPGVAERVLPQDDWAVFRRWAWNGARRGEDPDLDRQLADLSRPGALVAGLNWYRANIDPATFIISDPTRISVPPVACPTMGVWSSDDFALTEAQMTGSERFVSGPWRYERLDGVDHWVPVHAHERLNELLVDFLDESSARLAPRLPR
jgi:pimeloyl-ACP methyl ester carboxylesterase